MYGRGWNLSSQDLCVFLRWLLGGLSTGCESRTQVEVIPLRRAEIPPGVAVNSGWGICLPHERAVRSQRPKNNAYSPVAMACSVVCLALWKLRRRSWWLWCAGLGVATRGGRHFNPRSGGWCRDRAPGVGAGGTPLAVLGSRVGTLRDRQDKMSDLWPKVDSMGMQVQDIAPRLRHVCWKAEVELIASDQAVMDQEFCARRLQSAEVSDQLNVSEFACMELTSETCRCQSIDIVSGF